MSSTERRDFLGRTEADLVASIARLEGVYKIASAFTGGRYIQELERQQKNLNVDRRQLAILRGEAVDDSPRLSPAAREKQNRELAGFERYSRRV